MHIVDIQKSSLMRRMRSLTELCLPTDQQGRFTAMVRFAFGRERANRCEADENRAAFRTRENLRYRQVDSFWCERPACKKGPVPQAFTRQLRSYWIRFNAYALFDFCKRRRVTKLLDESQKPNET
jgi:hypothetical protein